MNKLFIINFLICFISYNSLAQSVKVLGVNHADSVQHDAPFYLNTFYIVNDGNIPIQGSSYHLYFSVVPNNPSLPASNFTIDTSTTPLYDLPQITSIFEDIELDINDTNNMFYDMLGRKINNIISLPSGSMYFSRNGKRYIKL